MLLIGNRLQRNFLAVIMVDKLQHAVQPLIVIIVDIDLLLLRQLDREVAHQMPRQHMQKTQRIIPAALRLLARFPGHLGQIAANAVIDILALWRLIQGITRHRPLLVQQIRTKLQRKQDIILICTVDLMHRHAVDNDNIILLQFIIPLIHMNGNRALQNINNFNLLMPMKRDICDTIHEQPNRQILLIFDKLVEITHRQGLLSDGRIVLFLRFSVILFEGSHGIIIADSDVRDALPGLGSFVSGIQASRIQQSCHISSNNQL